MMNIIGLTVCHSFHILRDRVCSVVIIVGSVTHTHNINAIFLLHSDFAVYWRQTYGSFKFILLTQIKYICLASFIKTFYARFHAMEFLILSSPCFSLLSFIDFTKSVYDLWVCNAQHAFFVVSLFVCFFINKIIISKSWSTFQRFV